jgi:hypothetical protein
LVFAVSAFIFPRISYWQFPWYYKVLAGLKKSTAYANNKENAYGVKLPCLRLTHSTKMDSVKRWLNNVGAKMARPRLAWHAADLPKWYQCSKPLSGCWVRNGLEN